MSNNYNDDSIKQLKGADRVRLRPGVMFGSDDIKGAFHTVKEILGNSLDEARAGYGKLIELTYHKDGSISIRDYGRGVPMDYNRKAERYNWDLVFNELYAGGKYDEDGDNYQYSIGLNGLGAASVQYTSEFFRVESYIGNKVYKKEFVKGHPLDDGLVIEENTTGKTGTFIHWKIDNEVFPDTDFTFKMFKDLCESQAHINEVDFYLKDERTGEEVEIKGVGIEHYLREQLGDKVIDVLTKKGKSTGVERGKKYSAECEIVLAITEETRSKQLHFHNTGAMVTGVHISAFEDAINEFFKTLGKRNNVTIIPSDYNDFLSGIVSTYSNITSFANQTKDGVSNNFIYSMIRGTLKDMLEEAVAKGLESVTTLVENVLVAALARKRAKEIEAQERLVKRTTSKRAKPSESKFAGCKETDPSKREVFIVEGDSAKGACKNARDGVFQAILAVKGKPMNCLKASMEDILDNQEVRDIIATVGTGVDIAGSQLDLFDMDKLNYDKIIITTDADVDGYQIRVLLYTVFYRLMPQLLEQGKVYIAETPLFEIETTRGSYFAYSNEEKDEILEDLRKQRIGVHKVNRSKGLGANNPDVLWETTMNPETRRLIQLDINVKDQIVRDITNMLFGTDPGNGRKDFIFDMLEAGLQDLVELVDNLDTETLKQEEEAI